MKKMIIVILSVIFTTTLCTACGSPKASAEASNVIREVKEEAQDIAEEMAAEDTEITEVAEIAESATEATEVTEVTEVAEMAESTEVVAAPATTAANNVDYHDYLNGNTFDLTAYAEAMGYTWIPDPEWEGLAMYAIENNGIRYFLCYQSNRFCVLFGDQNGKCWATSGITASGEHEYTIKSKGQDDTESNLATIELLANCFAFMRDADLHSPEDVMNIPATNSFSLRQYDGALSYYPNGMIKQREFGEGTDISYNRVI